MEEVEVGVGEGLWRFSLEELLYLSLAGRSKSTSGLAPPISGDGSTTFSDVCLARERRELLLPCYF